MYGNGDVDVVLNGERQLITNVTGKAGFGPSHLVPDRNHTMYELALPASPGGFGVQLHDPVRARRAWCVRGGPTALIKALCAGEQC